MNSSGYIKLYRTIKDQPWYQDSEAVHLFMHLLIEASHTERKYIVKGEPVTLLPGQFLTGRKQLSVNTGINESKVQRLLKLFENCGQIEQQTNNVNRCISILNWSKYQASEQQMNNERTTSEQRVNNERTQNKNYKELKERKEGEENAAAILPGSFEFDLMKRIGAPAAQLWVQGEAARLFDTPAHAGAALDWLTYRCSIGKPLRSQYELSTLVARFKSKNLNDLKEVIQYSIGGQYPDLYFDRLEKKNRKSAAPNRHNLDPEDLEKMRQAAKTTPSGVKLL